MVPTLAAQQSYLSRGWGWKVPRYSPVLNNNHANNGNPDLYYVGHCIDEMIMMLICDVCHCQAFASLVSYTTTTHRNIVRMDIMHIRGVESSWWLA